ncbi:MAG: S9 family peptidase [Gammaproteobacteria bacterium]|nr:S9 family peptidase [Gammaproteobacteria bacterium]
MSIIKNIIAILFTITVASAYAQKMPVEMYAKDADIESLRLSPTGEYYAARVKQDGKRSVVVIDRKSMKIKYAFNFGDEKDYEAGSYGWLNDERVYVRMQRMVGPLDTPGASGQLYAGNIDGSKLRQLLPVTGKSVRQKNMGERQFSMVSMLIDDPEHILVNIYDDDVNEVYKLNVYNGFARPIVRAPAKFSQIIADDKGEPRFAISTDSETNKASIFYREDDWKLIKEQDVKRGSIYPIELAEDGKSALVFVSNDELDSGIYQFSFEDQSFALVYELEGDADVEDFIFADGYRNKGLVGVVRQPDRRVSEYFGGGAEVGLLKAVDGLFPDQFVSFVSTTKDYSTSLLVVYSDVNPGQYYLFHHKTNKMSPVMKLQDHIDRKSLAKVNPIEFKARDGKLIKGYLTLPKGKTKNLPMVVYVHGGPYGVRDNWHFNYSSLDQQFLANRGYAVLQINYRGSGGRGTEFEYGAYRKMGMEMQDDLTDGTLWAVEQGFADKDRLCIYGASYGGYAAMMAVIKEPDLYKCAIPYVGVYDIAIQAASSDTAKFKSGRIFLEEAWNAYDEAFIKERSPIYHLNKLKAALFFVHGGEDKRVPVENYEKIASALDKMDYPYQSMIKGKEGHGFVDEDNRKELLIAIEKFLDKHIGE